MKLTQHNLSTQNVIRSYSSTGVHVGERELTQSCLIAGDAVITDWPLRTARDLAAEHLDPIFALAPEIVVLACPGRAELPRAAIRAQFAERRIGLEVMELGAACRTYNVLLAEGRRVVAAIALG